MWPTELNNDWIHVRKVPTLPFCFLHSASVDLQLPQVEGSMASAPSDLPPEPKPKFKERIITSLGEEGGPASFRKNKTQNGKSRSLRQRDDDDDD